MIENDTSIKNLKVYISEKNTLSNEAVLWLFRKEHSKRTEDDIRRLVDSNLAMVFKIATNFHRSHTGISKGEHHIEIMDLFNAGVLGLNKAVEKFDAYRGTKFSTFAYNWISQAVRAEIRSIIYPMKSYSYAPVFFENIDDPYSNFVDEGFEDASTKDMVEYIKTLLTSKEFTIFRLYFLEQNTMTDVAIKRDCALSTIQYSLKKIRKKLEVLKKE